uniref:Uncharacterized protein n=1 Tax=Cairina moschata TaxID=8855 RepID=A0A8C3GIY2_CAIMO
MPVSSMFHIETHHLSAAVPQPNYKYLNVFLETVLDGWQQFCQTNTTCLSQKDSSFNIVLMLEAFSNFCLLEMTYLFWKCCF